MASLRPTWSSNELLFFLTTTPDLVCCNDFKSAGKGHRDSLSCPEALPYSPKAFLHKPCFYYDLQQ
jgi:hypothetical protein